MNKPAGNVWEAYEAKTWTERIPAMPLAGTEEYEAVETVKGKEAKVKKTRQRCVEVTFTEAGDAAALVDLTLGTGLGNRDLAMQKLVVSSVVDPPLTPIQYNALSTSVKTALFMAIVEKVKVGEEKADFPGGLTGSPGTEKERATPDGGSGAPQRSSVTVIPTGSPKR